MSKAEEGRSYIEMPVIESGSFQNPMNGSAHDHPDLVPPHPNFLGPQPLLPLFSEKSVRLGFMRKLLLLRVFGIIVFLNVVFWIMEAFFLGSGYKYSSLLGVVSIAVIDFDQGFIASALQTSVNEWNSNPMSHEILVWQDGATLYNNDVSAAYSAVDNGDYGLYGALIINPGASYNLTNALNSTSPGSYNPQSVLTLVYDLNRNPSSVTTYVVIPMLSFINQFAFKFSTEQLASLINTLLNSTTSSIDTLNSLSKNPAALAMPIGFFQYQLHASSASVGFNASTIALIFLFIISMIGSAVSVLLGNVLKAKVNKWHVFAVQLIGLLIYALTLSFSMGALVAIYGAEFPRNWGSYWAMIWLTACALAYTTQAFYFTLPLPIAAVVSIVFLVMNVASSEFISFLSLSDPFFEYGYAFPFHNAVSASRTLLFGSYDRLYQNLPVLAAWIVGSILVSTLMTHLEQPPIEQRKKAAESFTRGVERAHNVFKRTIQKIIETNVESLPSEKRVTFAQFIHTFKTFLEAHHEGEDEIIFPAARARSLNKIGPLIDKLSGQHKQLHEVLDRIHILTVDANKFTSENGKEIQKMLSEVQPWLFTHLDTEVREMNVEFYVNHYTLEDINAVHARASQQAQGHGDPRWIMPYLIYSFDPEERKEFGENLPWLMRSSQIPLWTKVHFQVWKDWSPFLALDKNGQPVFLP